MKNLKHFSMTAVLTLLLTGSALAGDIEIGKAPPPPPSSSSTLAPGEILIPGDIQLGAPSGSAAEVALNLLLSAMSAF